MSKAKKAAGQRAAELVTDGMRVGLGTGSTVYYALERLSERVRSEGLTFVGVPTSLDTEQKALEMGLSIATLEEVAELDLAIDGADEIDPDFHMIKGGGGALLREKVVASISARVVIVVGRDKLVERLGLSFLLPVEVVPFARPAVARALKELGAVPILRLGGEGQVYLTDNGNQILDCKFAQGIRGAPALERAIDEIPGVVESGLFVDLAHLCVIGDEDGTTELRERS